MKEALQCIKSFDFHDGRIVSVQLTQGDAFLTFLDWRERSYTLHFKTVVYFQACEFGDVIARTVRTRSPEIEKAIEAIEIAKGTSEGYEDYAFIHLELLDDGLPLNIVFLDCTVTENLPANQHPSAEDGESAAKSE